MSGLLERVLEPRSLRVLFQPVMNVAGAGRSVEYLEALVRGPHGSTLETGTALFSYARRKRVEARVDRSAVRAILREARWLPDNVALGLNVHMSTLASDPEFPNFLCEVAQECWIDPARLVVELVEDGPRRDAQPLRESLACLRTIRVRTALDDFGAGRSNLDLVPDCRPDYLKAARSLVCGCQADPHRKAVLSAVVSLGRSVGSRVVAEGVETAEELHTVLELGIQRVQGSLFGQPQPAAVFRARLAPDGALLASAS